MKKLLLIFVLLCNTLISVYAEEEFTNDENLNELATHDQEIDEFNLNTFSSPVLNRIRRVGKLNNGAYITMMEMDGTLVYCLNPTLLADLGTGYQIDYDHYSQATKDRLWQFIFFGYQFNGHEDDSWFAATQMCIWNELGFYVDAFTLDGAYWDLSAQINEIRWLVDHARTTPSFHTQTIEVDYNTPFTLIDSNHALEHYDIKSVPGVDLISNNNTLTIQVTDLDYTQNISFSYGASNSCIIYIKPGYQDVISVSRNEPGATFNFQLHVRTGNLIISKLDEFNNPVTSPTAFELYWDADCTQLVSIHGQTTFETNAEGKLSFLNVLPAHTYMLKEIRSGQQFISNPTIYPISIVPNTETTLDVINRYREVQIVIEKSDLEYPNLKLDNAFFEIKETDAEDILFSGLTGSVYLQIVDPLTHLPESETSIKILDETNAVVIETITDQWGQVKLDDLQLEEKTYFWKSEKSTENHAFQYTSKTGTGLLHVDHLVWGKSYDICEVQAPNGYEMMENRCQTITMDLEQEESVKFLKFSNQKRRLDLRFYKCDSDDFSLKLNDAVFQFTIKSSQNQVPDQVQRNFTGRLYIHEVDENDNNLVGIPYQISKSLSFNDIVSLETTDLDGEIIVQLAPGHYYAKNMLTDIITEHHIDTGQIYFQDLTYGDIVNVCEVFPPTGYHIDNSCRDIVIQAGPSVEEILFNFDNSKIETYEEIIPKMGI